MMCWTLSSINRSGAKERAQHNGGAPSSADWKGQKNNMKRYTLSSATPFGSNAMFSQIGKRYSPF
jgi:hypothetical protein